MKQVSHCEGSVKNQERVDYKARQAAAPKSGEERLAVLSLSPLNYNSDATAQLSFAKKHDEAQTIHIKSSLVPEEL